MNKVYAKTYFSINFTVVSVYSLYCSTSVIVIPYDLTKPHKIPNKHILI